jgi:hypothetical protein
VSSAASWSARSSRTQRLGTIARDEESPTFKLELSMEDSRIRPRPLWIHVSWSDGAGQHDENIAELNPF